MCMKAADVHSKCKNYCRWRIMFTKDVTSAMVTKPSPLMSVSSASDFPKITLTSKVTSAMVTSPSSLTSPSLAVSRVVNFSTGLHSEVLPLASTACTCTTYLVPLVSPERRVSSSPLSTVCCFHKIFYRLTPKIKNDPNGYYKHIIEL